MVYFIYIEKGLKILTAGLVAMGGLVEAQEDITAKIRGKSNLFVPISDVAGNVDLVIGGEKKNVFISIKSWSDGSKLANLGDAKQEGVRVSYDVMDRDGNGFIDRDDLVHKKTETPISQKEGGTTNAKTIQREFKENEIPEHLRKAYEVFAADSMVPLSSDVQVDSKNQDLGKLNDLPTLAAEGHFSAEINGVKSTVAATLGRLQGYPTFTMSVDGSSGETSYDGLNRIDKEVTRFRAWEFWDKDADGVLEDGEPVWEVLTSNLTDYQFDAASNLKKVAPQQIVFRKPASKKEAPRDAAQVIYSEMRDQAEIKFREKK